MVCLCGVLAWCVSGMCWCNVLGTWNVVLVRLIGVVLVWNDVLVLCDVLMWRDASLWCADVICWFDALL